MPGSWMVQDGYDGAADPGRVVVLSRAIRETSGVSGRVERVMSQLGFASVSGDTADCPSLAKAEIVRLYDDFVTASAKSTKPRPASGA